MNAMDIKKLSTEGRNPETTDLDEMSPLEIVSVMNQEDEKVPAAIKPELPKIAQAVEKISASFKQGGRLFYVGAGTSGRLGVLDAAECVPTFGTDPDMVQGLIAGGSKAMTLAVEGAEDDVELGGQDLKARKLSDKDVVVGIAASGRTPYVVGALDYAKEIGADTIALSCNQNAVISQHADTKIEVVVGPEVLSGSTRLKSGTAQKMVLNMLSTAAMVRVGKTYGNLMVDVKPTNKKLVQRSINIIVEVTGVSADIAETTLQEADFSVKDAIVMISNKMDQATAKQKLVESGGFVRQAIK